MTSQSMPCKPRPASRPVASGQCFVWPSAPGRRGSRSAVGAIGRASDLAGRWTPADEWLDGVFPVAVSGKMWTLSTPGSIRPGGGCRGASRRLRSSIATLLGEERSGLHRGNIVRARCNRLCMVCPRNGDRENATDESSRPARIGLDCYVEGYRDSAPGVSGRWRTLARRTDADGRVPHRLGAGGG